MHCDARHGVQHDGTFVKAVSLSWFVQTEGTLADTPVQLVCSSRCNWVSRVCIVCRLQHSRHVRASDDEQTSVKLVHAVENYCGAFLQFVSFFDIRVRPITAVYGPISWTYDIFPLICRDTQVNLVKLQTFHWSKLFLQRKDEVSVVFWGSSDEFIARTDCKPMSCGVDCRVCCGATSSPPMSRCVKCIFGLEPDAYNVTTLSACFSPFES